ncbi:MAG: 50S ribosomal protein L3, partial [Clostridia bacterium]|nr:50S ribosomal protein L3 [Clostridia bacterium]
MKKAILGKKLGMSQVFAQDGSVIPVTIIEAGPCYVTQVKNKETDGYEAVQIAFGEIKAKNVNKCQTGAYKKAGVEPKRTMQEFKLDNSAEFALGQEVKCDVFAE